MLAITLMNLRNLRYRIATSLVICIGIGGVVAVLITVLAMATGLEQTLGSAGRSDRAIVVREGAIAEVLSSITREAALAIEAAPGVGLDATGKRLISPETVVSVLLPKRDADVNSAVPVRGVTPNVWHVRPEIDLLEGRYFEPGLHEVVVGRTAQEQFDGLNIGESVHFHSTEWLVVGTFSSDRDAHEAEMLADAATLMSASKRSVFSAITVVLDNPESFAAFRSALEEDPRLKIDARRETDYYAERSKQVSQLLYFVAYVVGSIMAVGALFGAMNTMYSAVSARTVEIATLRAIGFGARPVVVSVLIEALGLAIIGALVGVFIAWLLFNGNDVSSGGALGLVTTRLNVGFAHLSTGLLWACAVGFLGGLFPALRAARMPVVAGLRVTV